MCWLQAPPAGRHCNAVFILACRYFAVIPSHESPVFSQHCNAVFRNTRLSYGTDTLLYPPSLIPVPCAAPSGHSPASGPAPRTPPGGAPPARFQNHRCPGQRWRPRMRHRPAGQWRPRAWGHVGGASQSPGARGRLRHFRYRGRACCGGAGRSAEEAVGQVRGRGRGRSRSQCWGGTGVGAGAESVRGPDPARAEAGAGRRPGGAGGGLCALRCGNDSPALRYAAAS